MNALEIVRNAIPNASDELCDFILWERTPFPVGHVTARSLYAAANRFHRAYEHGKKLCMFCDKLAVTETGFDLCELHKKL